jgi:hypothetical protein
MVRRELDPRAVARVVGAFAFEAVRGRTGSGAGAAPAHRLADLRLDGLDEDKRTVARKAMQGYRAGSPPSTTATPFDFAMTALFDWSRNGGQESFEAALQVMGVVMVPLDPGQLAGAIASLLRFTVQDQFDSPDARFLTGFGIQALALEYIRESGFRQLTVPDRDSAGPDESLVWARWLMDQRRHEARKTTEGYLAVLSFGLLLMRRRPKPGYTIAQIVRAAQSLWIGGVHRALLDPDDYPEYGSGAPESAISPVTGLPEGDGQIERAMVDLIVGMTEESLFAVNQASIESRLVVEGLQRYRTAQSIVGVESLLEASGADPSFVREQFPTDRDFAGACFQWLAGEWDGFGSFAREFRGAATAGVDVLLGWVGKVHREFPALLVSAGFMAGDPAFEEVVAFVSQVLSRGAHGTAGVVGPGDVKRARRCVEAAAVGGDWRIAAGLVPRQRPAIDGTGSRK